MFLYFFVIFFFLIISSKRLVISGKSLYSYGCDLETLIFIFLAFFLCAGYMTGSDWRNYEPLYAAANWTAFKYYKNEQLFYILMIYSKEILPNFFVFMIICKVVVLLVFWKFFKKYSVNNFTSVFFFIPLFGLFLFIDNPLRFMIALGFSTVSYKYMIDSKFWKFFALVILGSFFHITVLFFLPFYFIRQLKINSKVLIIIFLLWTFLFTTKNLLSIIDIADDYIPILDLRFSNYILNAEDIEKSFSIGLVINLVFFGWVIYYRDRIEKDLKHGNLFFSMTILYLFTTKLAVIFPTGFRFTYFFAPFFVLVLAFLLEISTKKTQRLFSYGIVLYVALFTYKKIDDHYVYLPYSNYFVNLIESTPKSYNYRANYNREQYRKRKGHYFDSNE